MKKVISAKSILKVVGWTAIISAILLLIMKVFGDEHVSTIAIVISFFSGVFCLSLGYMHDRGGTTFGQHQKKQKQGNTS